MVVGHVLQPELTGLHVARDTALTFENGDEELVLGIFQTSVNNVQANRIASSLK